MVLLGLSAYLLVNTRNLSTLSIYMLLNLIKSDSKLCLIAFNCVLLSGQFTE